MAAPIYDNDLQDITLCESTTGFSALGGGASGLGTGPDFAIQGNNAVDKQVTGALKGMVYDFGSTITLGANDHIFIWEVCATPGITSTKATGGIRVTIGTATNAYYEWYVNGADTLPGGGIQNYAIYYTGSTFDNQVGSPGASPRWFGGQANVTGTAKSPNFALDAMRYGTGFYITQGDATTPITFSGSAAINDNNANRYGVLAKSGAGYALKGRYVVGQDTSQVATAAYFEDLRTSVSFTDTEYSLPDFTQIIVDHPSTQFYATSIAFTGLGTNNPGKITFLDSATTGSFTKCTFNSIGQTRLNSNVTVTGGTFARSAEVYQSGSSFSSTTFSTPTAATSSLISDDPSLVSDCIFEGDGTRHGIEVVSTGTYTFSGNTFTGFVSGSASGSMLLFNPPGGTGDLTLNIAGGGDTPNFTNLSTGTVTINNNISVTLTGMKDNTEVRIYRAGTTTEIAGIEDVTAGSVDNRSFTFSDGAANSVDIVIISVQYVNERIDGYTIPATDSELPIQQSFDRNYSNP